MIPVVLVHGGGGDSRIWDPLLPHVDHLRTLAVDLPGRGSHPSPLRDLTLAGCAASVAADVDAAGFDEVVLVGHSMAGCSIPGIVALLGERVRHLVFVACTVPPHGQSAYDTIDPVLKELIEAERGKPGEGEPRPMDPALARAVFGNDLDDDQWAWAEARLVPEAPGLTLEPVDLSPLPIVPNRTWARTLRDVILPPARQLDFVANVGECRVVDIDAGHLCMVSRPESLAAVIREAAGDV